MIEAIIDKTIVMYRYKLNENHKDKNAVLNNVFLTKDWTVFSTENHSLSNFIRTKENPKGIVDYEEFNRITNGVRKSSYVDFKKRFPLYTREVLASMPRKLLVDICKAYSIDVIGKKPEFLVEKIIEKQHIYKEQEEQRKEEEKKIYLEELVERKVNEYFSKDAVVDVEKAKIDIIKEIENEKI